MGSIDKACISGFLCRLCSEMHRIVIHIYGDQGQRLCLVEKINGYLPITISPTDPLPKTICTTCLRRVEQHYDLLMRMLRIKEERFVRVNNKQHPRVSPISSIENSEDEVYQSEDDSHRGQQRDLAPSQRSNLPTHFLPSPAISSAPVFSSALSGGPLNSRLVTIAHIDENGGGNADQSGASTSASAIAAITQHINVLNDTNSADLSSPSSSLSSHQVSIENVNSSGIVLQQHSD